MSSTDPTPPGATRRGVLAGFIYAAAGAMAASLAVLLGRFFTAPLFARSRGRREAIPLGPIDRFRDSREPVPAFFERTVPDGYMKRRESGRVYVVADGNRFFCLSSTCTHLGCTVHWDRVRQEFLCPCHGGVYARDGSVVAGPPPRPLRRLPVQIDGGELVLAPSEDA
jgi:quinol---cytochrome c reductase iron-sulfur subunit, bacillus type